MTASLRRSGPHAGVCGGDRQGTPGTFAAGFTEGGSAVLEQETSSP
ncbi:hypothetical protein AB0K02_06680 [Streptomyces sp. NPDC049597]